MRRWHRYLPELSVIAGGVMGALGGVIVAQPVLRAAAPGCAPIAQAYGLCHPHVGTPWGIAIYVGFVVAGALLGWQAGRLFSPTFKRFVGDAGSVELAAFRVKGDFARIEWSAQGDIRITNGEQAGFELRSGPGSGTERFPAGRYSLKVAASGPWIVRVARG